MAHLLKRDERGAAALEFALLAPILLTLLFGIIQLGLLFFASAGLDQAVGEGARLATLYPRPSNSAIAARISAKRFGLDPSKITGPTISSSVADSDADYLDISMSYSTEIEFLFISTPPIKLTRTRRVWINATNQVTK